jgi:hypothetical protein
MGMGPPNHRRPASMPTVDQIDNVAALSRTKREED